MTNNLLSLVNQKNHMYRDWKSANKINFKTFEKIVDQNIIDVIQSTNQDGCVYAHSNKSTF